MWIPVEGLACGERPDVFSLGVYGHCTDFPTSANDGRDLLEIDIGDPSDEGPDVASPAVVTYIATDLELGVVDTTGTP